jgi:hypothetical protein
MGIFHSKSKLPVIEGTGVFHHVRLCTLQQKSHEVPPYPNFDELPICVNYHVTHPCSVKPCQLCNWKYRITRVDAMFKPTFLPLVTHVELAGVTEECQIGLTTKQYMHYFQERPDVSWYRTHPIRRQSDEPATDTDDQADHKQV